MTENIKISRRDFLLGNWGEGKMTDKVRYERRVFYHQLVPEDEMSLDQLVSPLAKICLGFGGFPGVESVLYDPADTSNTRRKVRTNITYVVGKKNGAAAVVELDVESRAHGYRVTNVVNLERYEHQELLAALHAFFDGKPRYHGMPETEIVEREIKTK